MERNINDINREPCPSFRGAPFGVTIGVRNGDRHGFAEPLGLREIRGSSQRLLQPELSSDGSGFFGDLTKKLVSSAGEKAASAIGSKAGEAIGNKFFNRQKKKLKSPEGASLEPPKAAPIVEENKGSELIKLLQLENKLSPQSSIHEIYNRLLE